MNFENNGNVDFKNFLKIIGWTNFYEIWSIDRKLCGEHLGKKKLTDNVFQKVFM